MLNPLPRRRRGIAAVELAFVAPVLVTILAGLWEVGRMVQLQQLISNPARGGSRAAPQGRTLNSPRRATPHLVHPDPTVGTPGPERHRRRSVISDMAVLLP